MWHSRRGNSQLSKKTEIERFESNFMTGDIIILTALHCIHLHVSTKAVNETLLKHCYSLWPLW